MKDWGLELKKSMERINVKPMSINVAWQGKRFKTKEYQQYETVVKYLLPPNITTYDKMHISLEFGVSSKLFDWDNAIKPFVDILQKKYGFDDKVIYEANVRKVLVPKGKEYIKFKLSEIQE